MKNKPLINKPKKKQKKSSFDKYEIQSISHIKQAQGEEKAYNMLAKVMWMLSYDVPRELIEEIVLECGFHINKLISINFEWKASHQNTLQSWTELK